MIYRLQSLYLSLIILISGLFTFIFPLWQTNKNIAFFVWQGFKSKNNLIISITVAFFLVIVIAMLSLFGFKKRKKQFMLNRLNIVVNLYLLGVLLYYLLNLSGGIVISEKGISAFFPIINIFLLALANKAIKKDEALVKSVDRLR